MILTSHYQHGKLLFRGAIQIDCAAPVCSPFVPRLFPFVPVSLAHPFSTFPTKRRSKLTVPPHLSAFLGCSRLPGTLIFDLPY